MHHLISSSPGSQWNFPFLQLINNLFGSYYSSILQWSLMQDLPIVLHLYTPPEVIWVTQDEMEHLSSEVNKMHQLAIFPRGLQADKEPAKRHQLCIPSSPFLVLCSVYEPCMLQFVSPLTSTLFQCERHASLTRTLLLTKKKKKVF